MTLKQTIPLAGLAFLVPLGVAACGNWSSVRPYLVADPNTAEGELLYFTARRG